MEKFNNLLKNFDLSYFGSGKHKITFDEMMELKKEDKAYILDVRSAEENELVSFNFSSNIPIEEIPERIDEIPTNKSIVVFCSSATRATIVSLYLQLNGFDDVKILLEGISDLSSHFKPGYVLKNRESMKTIVKK